MMRCPITYGPCDRGKYSAQGLRLLSRRLTELHDFPFTAKEQLQLAAQCAAKLSIQGVQPKLSAVLDTAKATFVVVHTGGRFILKPPHPMYDELPQNEDLTMKLAHLAGIKTPLHGMIYNIDGSLTYFIKRFDRVGKKEKRAVEDFAQLLDARRDTKYDSSMEKVASVIEKNCTHPDVDTIQLFRLVIFNFLVGNEDMHLKNFMLLRENDVVSLSPAFDLVNSTLVLHSDEELALPLRGKKRRISRTDIVDYFAHERLGISTSRIEQELRRFERAIPSWQEMIDRSFLSEQRREEYWQLIQSRWQRLL